MPSEEAVIRERYARRPVTDPRYSWFSPGYVFLMQDHERRVLALLAGNGCLPIDRKRILEIGCGTGYWLREFLKWGARPENIVGVDLLATRLTEARRLCPQSVKLVCESAFALAFKIPSSLHTGTRCPEDLVDNCK
jgi:ubiquinone/menaquinone biosynthesis C-methylase UbiE